jgi:hypothetical protein
MRLSGRAWLVLGAALGILIVFATDQVLPETSAYQAQMRFWLAARATGITAYLLLTALVTFGSSCRTPRTSPPGSSPGGSSPGTRTCSSSWSPSSSPTS